MRTSPSEVAVERLVVGQMAGNCYIVSDPSSKKAIIIDPGDDAGFIAEHIAAAGAAPVAIIATHGHFDHILAAGELQAMFRIPFCVHADDVFLVSAMQKSASYFLGRTVIELPPRPTRKLRDGECMQLGKTRCTVVATPGHTPGGISLSVGEHMIFVGDTMFADGGVGRVDFSYSDGQALKQSVCRILSFAKDTMLYPGHGEETTVAQELRYHNDICR
jgi:hydroxyacylglutathione hydrolase